MYPLQTSLSASVDKIDSTRRKAKGQKNPENYSSAHTKQSSPNRTLSEKSVKKKAHTANILYAMGIVAL